MYPELHSFCLNENHSVQNFMQRANISDNFHPPLSTQAFQQIQELQDDIANLQLNSDPDKWHYRWNSDSFSSMKAYKHMTSGPLAHAIFQKIWKSVAILIYKIFFWLLLHDRLNTRNLLSRKYFHLPSYSCVLCSETWRRHHFICSLTALVP